MQQEGKYVSTIVRAQRSRFLGTEDEYLCITLARPGQSENSSRLGGEYAQGRNISVTLGLLINADVKRQIKWLDDVAIQARCDVQWVTAYRLDRWLLKLVCFSRLRRFSS